MILIDLSQVLIANLMVHINNNAEINEDLVRHMIFNNIRSYKKKFSSYGEVVLCCDDSRNWRKKEFSYYKAHRKLEREVSAIDWNSVFKAINTVRDEIKEHMPYKTLQVPRAEADDIIGALVRRFGTQLNADGTEQILIISGDKDFAQLQTYANVKQYSPKTKQFISVADPQAFLKEHIIRGDKGDGVPNIKSTDNCILTKERQKSISKVNIKEWLKLEPEEFCDEYMLAKYKRNEKLISLWKTPQDIVQQIWNMYDEVTVPPRSGIYNYFVKKGLVNLLSQVNDF